MSRRGLKTPRQAVFDATRIEVRSAPPPIGCGGLFPASSYRPEVTLFWATPKAEIDALRG